jgi:long-chain-alcohol oxidase
MEQKGEREHVSFASRANGKEDDHTVIEVDMQGLLEAGDHRRQGQPPYNYVNSLSSWEMETLTALCDTFLPPVDVSDVTTDEAIVKFFSTSASMAGTPERV